MPYHNAELHGSVPERSRVALVLIDVINPMDFPGSRGLVRNATRAATHIQALRMRARKKQVPCIYVNDNFGRWRSDFQSTVQNAQSPKSPGRAIAMALSPADDDYFVLKPKRSGFYGTSLDLLLSYLGTDTLVIAGFAGDMCVQSTVHDAFLRDLRILLASDCIASDTQKKNRVALERMERELRAEVKAGKHVDFGALGRVTRPRL